MFILHALPTYAMGNFKCPAGLCDDLSHFIQEYLWGDDKYRKKVHWLTWDNIVKLKGLGCMGFRELWLFNQALLARHAWWPLVVNPDSLCTWLMKAQYYPNGHLIDTS